MGELKKTYSAETLLQYAYKHNQIPVILFAKDKECRYIYTSEVEELLNSGQDRSILGKTDLEIQPNLELGRLYYEQDKEIMKTGQPCCCYSEFYENGRKVFREVIKNPVYNEGELIGVCGVVSDVTELMNLKKKFEALALFDNLTGTYNRNYFLQYDFNKSSCLPCAYVMCDCNDLKGVNDKIGHSAGDHYIQTTAEILKLVLPPEGICIRWGGDEFLMIIPEYEEYKCHKLVEEIDKIQETKKETLPYLEIAIGFSIRHTLEQTEHDVILSADQNMYMDKMKRKKFCDGNKKRI